MEESDPFWINQPGILIRDFYKVIPNGLQTTNHNLNVVTRDMIYLSLIILMFGKRKYVMIPLIVIAVIVLLYYLNQPDVEEGFQNEDELEPGATCQPPTSNNPFMNFTYSHYFNKDKKLPACPVKTKGFFKSHIYRDVDDLYNRGHEQRNFYTMPVTTLINDQTGYANYLYGTPATCKEDTSKCLKYEDIRVQTHNPYTAKN